MSELSGGCKQSEQSGANKQMSGASERANGRVRGPVLTSLFLFVPDHSATSPTTPQLVKNGNGDSGVMVEKKTPVLMGVDLETANRDRRTPKVVASIPYRPRHPVQNKWCSSRRVSIAPFPAT